MICGDQLRQPQWKYSIRAERPTFRRVDRAPFAFLVKASVIVAIWMRGARTGCLAVVEMRGFPTYSHIGIYYSPMARAATTSDAFNAVAEPRRRDILSYLALQERPVGDIVAALELEQPSVSKHLRVLKDVGLVRARRDGRQMLYRVNADAIRPLHEVDEPYLFGASVAASTAEAERASGREDEEGLM